MTPMLLSKRQAAKMLGIGRCGTLEDLIREGKLRTVSLAGRIRIPLAEVHRLAQDGTEPVPRTKSAPKPPRKPTSRAGGIRAIPI